MQNMLNTINNHMVFVEQNHIFDTNTTQMRHFDYGFQNVDNITVERSFNNPNVVFNDFSDFQNCQNGHSVSLSTCHGDSNNAAISFSVDAYINFSPSIIETIQETHLDVVQPVNNTDHTIQTINEISPEDELAMCKERTRKNTIRSRDGCSFKNKEQSVKNKKREINEMMDIDYESQLCSDISDISMTSKDYHFLTFNDFLCDENSDKVDHIEEENVNQDHFVVMSSPSIEFRFKRERTLSITESEDSFIVFESGSDDELKFSDDSQDDESEENSDEDDAAEDDTDEGELDSSPSVVPKKKVRFADNSDLCQVHPMITWSYAYQKARIGPWEKYALDRVRFNDRIKKLEEKIKPVLDIQHRDKIFGERFEI